MELGISAAPVIGNVLLLVALFIPAFNLRIIVGMSAILVLWISGLWRDGKQTMTDSGEETPMDDDSPE